MNRERVSTDRVPIAWGDSPWFWVALFSLAALAASMAIGPKFSRRQYRIEQKFDHRVQAWKSRERAREHLASNADAPDGAEAGSPAPRDEGAAESTAPTDAEYAPRPRAALAPLDLLLAVTATVGIVQLLLSRRARPGEGAMP